MSRAITFSGHFDEKTANFIETKCDFTGPEIKKLSGVYKEDFIQQMDEQEALVWRYFERVDLEFFW